MFKWSMILYDLEELCVENKLSLCKGGNLDLFNEWRVLLGPRDQ